MRQKGTTTLHKNEYQCAIEVNQNGKYCVRLRVTFGRPAWNLPLYFLASSFDRAMKKIEQSLQYLQQKEENLSFWGTERSDDPHLATELLVEVGLTLDRRSEFPRKAAQIAVAPDRQVPAFQIAPLRRFLAESLLPARVASD